MVSPFRLESYPIQGSCEISLAKVPSNQTGFLSAITFDSATTLQAFNRHEGLTLRYLVTAALFF